MPLIASCHCQATRLAIDSPPETLVSCTCSICSRRGALWAYYSPAQVTILQESDSSTYTWQSKTVKHKFCSVCGCTTYSLSPDWSSGDPDFDNQRFIVNARLLEDFDLAAVPVEVLDGKNQW